MRGGLRAFELREERELAGVVAGLLWVCAGVTVIALPSLPGIVTTDRGLVAAIAVVSVVWGVAALTVVPWARVPALVSHLSSATGFPATAAGVALTGGADSPAHLYLFFIVGYCAYFYAPRESWPYLVGCVTVTSLPLFYDDAAVSSGFLAEVLILSPTYLVLGGFILVGKRRLIELREQANDLALHDPLTGLYNRRFLFDALEREIARSHRYGSPVSLAIFDVDDFKAINDDYGHATGDQVLRTIGAVASDTIRATDSIARIGGEEFAILLPDTDREDALGLAERVRDAIRTGVTLGARTVTLSGGVAACPRDATGADGLHRSADAALYRAKADGKDRCAAAVEVELAQLVPPHAETHA